MFNDKNYRDMFIKLLPPGKYWTGEFFRKLGRGIGKEFARVDREAEEITKESTPESCTTQSISEWENFYLGKVYPENTLEMRKQRIKSTRASGKSNKFDRYLDIILSRLKPLDPDATALARMNMPYIITILIRTHIEKEIVINTVHPEIKKIMRISGGIQYIVRPRDN